MHRLGIGNHGSKKLLAALIAGTATLGWARASALAPGRARVLSHAMNRASVQRLAQAGDSDDETSVSSNEVDKYIAVYAAMQRDHSLTVEKAASHQGLTLPAFRQLENKIQQNAAVHDRVLKALRAAAKAGSGTGNPPAKPQ